jgi:hypothetical protein
VYGTHELLNKFERGEIRRKVYFPTKSSMLTADKVLIKRAGANSIGQRFKI